MSLLQTLKIQGIATFFSEVEAELKKVIWPSRKETVRLTTIVIAVSVAVAVFIMILDFIFSKLVSYIL